MTRLPRLCRLRLCRPRLCRSRATAALVALAFFLRAGYALSRPEGVFWPDAKVYHRLAENLARGAGYINDQNEPPDLLHHNPAWPFLMAAAMRLGADSTRSLRLLLAVVGTLGCVGIHLAAREAARGAGLRASEAETVGRVALFLAAVCPTQIYYTGTLLTETVAVAAVAWVLFAALSYLNRPDTRRAVLVGAVLGVAAYTKTHLLLFAYLAAAAALAGVFLRAIPPSRAAALLLPMLLLMGPWYVRNHRVAGVWAFTSQGGYTFWEGNNPYADGGPRKPGTPDPVRERYHDLPEVELRSKYTEAAVRWILEHPGAFLGLSAARIARTWNPVPNRADLFHPALWYVSLGWHLFLYAAAAGGAYVTRGAWRRLWPLYGVLLLLTAVHAVSVGSIRYREPMIPVLIVFAAYALTVPARHRTTNPSPTATTAT